MCSTYKREGNTAKRLLFGLLAHASECAALKYREHHEALASMCDQAKWAAILDKLLKGSESDSRRPAILDACLAFSKACTDVAVEKLDHELREPAKHAPGTVPGSRVTGAGTHTARRANIATCRYIPEVGAVCPNWARTDLCGGREVTRVPTAISGSLSWRHGERRRHHLSGEDLVVSVDQLDLHLVLAGR